MLSLCEPHILALEPYVPGKSIEESRKEYGISDWIKLASNENPFGPSQNAILHARNALEDVHLYPTFYRLPLKKRICQHLGAHGITLPELVLGNGSNDLIGLLVRSFVSRQEAVAYVWPSFIMYPISADIAGAAKLPIPLQGSFALDVDSVLRCIAASQVPVKLLFLSNPNNPVGTYFSKHWIEDLLKRLPKDIIVVVDEAYIEYVDAADYETALGAVKRRPRTVVLRTFSKIYGLAGLRIGYGVGDPQIVDILHRTRDPFNVNHMAQVAALHALDDGAHLEKSRVSNGEQKSRMQRELKHMGYDVVPSQGNFLLIGLPKAMKGNSVYLQLLRQGIIVRPVDNYELPHHIRVTIGKAEENTQFLQALKACV